MNMCIQKNLKPNKRWGPSIRMAPNAILPEMRGSFRFRKGCCRIDCQLGQGGEALHTDRKSVV